MARRTLKPVDRTEFQSGRRLATCVRCKKRKLISLYLLHNDLPAVCDECSPVQELPVAGQQPSGQCPDTDRPLVAAVGEVKP